MNSFKQSPRTLTITVSFGLKSGSGLTAKNKREKKKLKFYKEN